MGTVATIDIPAITERQAERFWSKVDKSDGCWIWLGRKAKQGYGRFGVGRGRAAVASRVAWFLSFGSIPPGLFVCHKCDNPSCVNPHHLFLGTALDNRRDALAKERQARGERQGLSKLSDEDVEEIRRRRRNGETFSSMARSLGMTCGAVRLAAYGETWKHVSVPAVEKPGTRTGPLLSDRQKVAVRACYAQGQSQRDIAKKFGVNPGTVFRTIHET